MKYTATGYQKQDLENICVDRLIIFQCRKAFFINIIRDIFQEFVVALEESVLQENVSHMISHCTGPLEYHDICVSEKKVEVDLEVEFELKAVALPPE